MVISHGEEKKQHWWGPALFLGDNLSGSCYEIGAKPRQEDKASILAGLKGSLQIQESLWIQEPTPHTPTLEIPLATPAQAGPSPPS